MHDVEEPFAGANVAATKPSALQLYYLLFRRRPPSVRETFFQAHPLATGQFLVEGTAYFFAISQRLGQKSGAFPVLDALFEAQGICILQVLCLPSHPQPQLIPPPPPTPRPLLLPTALTTA